MKVNYLNKIDKPAVVIVGTWDPLTSQHISMLNELDYYCVSNDFVPLVVILDPSPFNLVNKKVFPIYDCLGYRKKYLQHISNGIVCTVSMNYEDLESGIDDFLRLFSNEVCIAELWLREGQTMGRGNKSAPQFIWHTCKELGVNLRYLPPNELLKSNTTKIKKYLNEGQIVLAIGTAGHLPIWEKADLKSISIGWPAGKYKYKSVHFTTAFEILYSGAEGQVEVYENSEGNTVFDWPDEKVNTITILEP